MNDETRNIRRARASTPPALLTAKQRARLDETMLSHGDEIVDAVRASRLASSIVNEFEHGVTNRKWADIDLTLARHVLRLERRLAELCE